MPLDKLFHIGDMARLFHISVSSIRHYEKIGLVAPEYTDPETGYRYYSTRQFEVFNTICYLRALDMPLNEIADFLRNRDIDNIEEKLRKQKETVIEKQKELSRIERKIDNRLRQLCNAQSVELNRISLARSPACRLFSIDGAIRITTCSDLELPTSKLAESSAEAAIFLGKVGVGISAENLISGRYDQYDSIFLVLDNEDNFDGETTEIPESLCVSVTFNGSHMESPEQYGRLTEYIRANGLEIIGASREITMVDYGLTNDPNKFVTEISIPVK